MTQDNPNLTQALIEQLRAEINAEGDADIAEVELPSAVRDLLEDVRTPSGEVAAAVDELLASEVDTISSTLHAKLSNTLRGVATRAADSPRYLEQLLRSKREATGRTIDDIASMIELPVAKVASIESSSENLTGLQADQIAAWIDFLDLELDDAITALTRSLHQPATAYRGDHATKTKQELTSLAKEVRRLVEERRTLGKD